MSEAEQQHRDDNVQRFLRLVQGSKKAKFKVYLGMSAGVGKTYRMLQEAHALRRNGVDIRVAYIETHNRPETHQLLEGLELIPRRTLFYKGKALEELDVQAVIQMHPEVVIVDELAHSNIEGSKNEKRWQDVVEILDAGINVISAVNIQHIESLNEEIKSITGIEVSERIPDNILARADEVVNIDLTAGELISRLKEGKIYAPDKVESALRNFFKAEHILQLRELALREVAAQVERKIETELTVNESLRPERFLACISSNPTTSTKIIRKTARLAAYYGGRWCALYVQTKRERSDVIELSLQRQLHNSFKLIAELGAEVIRVESDDVADAIVRVAVERKMTTICIGRPAKRSLKSLLTTSVMSRLIDLSTEIDIDIIVLS